MEVFSLMSQSGTQKITTNILPDICGTQTITTNILQDISKRKDNQTIKFGQLIEYNVINIFLQKMRQGDYFYTSFCFLKKLYMK